MKLDRILTRRSDRSTLKNSEKRSISTTKWPTDLKSHTDCLKTSHKRERHSIWRSSILSLLTLTMLSKIRCHCSIASTSVSIIIMYSSLNSWELWFKKCQKVFKKLRNFSSTLIPTDFRFWEQRETSSISKSTTWFFTKHLMTIWG